MLYSAIYILYCLGSGDKSTLSDIEFCYSTNYMYYCS